MIEVYNLVIILDILLYYRKDFLLRMAKFCGERIECIDTILFVVFS